MKQMVKEPAIHPMLPAYKAGEHSAATFLQSPIPKPEVERFVSFVFRYEATLSEIFSTANFHHLLQSKNNQTHVLVFF